MAPSGLDVKRNIVRLAQLKGMKQSDFMDKDISSSTVKSVFRLNNAETPDLDTVNKFAKVLGVETYVLYKTAEKRDEADSDKEEFIKMVELTFGELSSERRHILLNFYKMLLQKD